MPDVVFTVDQSKSMRDQAVPGHNRWHPDIPVARIYLTTLPFVAVDFLLVGLLIALPGLTSWLHRLLGV